DALALPNRRAALVSLSVKTSDGDSPPEAGPASRWKGSSEGCSARTRPSDSSESRGRGQYPSPDRPQDQVLRNQSVGRTSSRDSSGEAFVTAMRTRRSSGDALAYSTMTSKYPS